MDALQRIFPALPAYLGGKRRLVPLIFGLLARVLPRHRWTDSSFMDPMCGAGSVALAAKAYGFQVQAGDIAERCVIVSRALIANSIVLVTLADIIRLSRGAAGRPVPAGDRWPGLFAAASRVPGPKRSLLQLVLIRAYLRGFPLSMPSASDAAHFVTGDLDRISPARLATYVKKSNSPGPVQLRRIADQVNRGVFGGVGSTVKGDARDVLANSDADVAYLDPPYAGTIGYTRTYAALDRLLGDHPPTSSPPSIDELLDAAGHIPLVVLSYGGPGVTADQIAERVTRHRPVVSAVEIPYPHLKAVATGKRRNKTNEVVIVAGKA